MADETGAVVAASVVVFVIISILVGIGSYKTKGRRERRLQAAYDQELAERENVLQAELAVRRAEEADEHSGSQIWFSRYIERGRLKHWVMVIDGIKYELRRDRETRNFTANVAPLPDWPTLLESRKASIESILHAPHAGSYYVCLIGWTKTTSKQREVQCNDIMSRFGRYDLLFNNCQDFLKDFAELIVSKQATDWTFFHDNMKTKYQEEQKMPLTPAQRMQQETSRAVAVANQIQNNNNIVIAGSAAMAMPMGAFGGGGA